MSLTSSFAKSVCVTAVTMALTSAAHAAAGRTFISGTGSDTNTATNCPRTAPCRTLAMAQSVTAAAGEIIALDAAGYGAITITGTLTLVGVSGAEITPPSGGTGVTISGSGTVIIDNFQVTSDGQSNTIGISLTGGNLVMRNSAFKFLTTGLSVTNAKASLYYVDFIGNTTGVSASGAGPNANFINATTEVLLFWGSALYNGTAYFMTNPGSTNPNILEFLTSNTSAAFSTSMGGNTTLVGGTGTGCPCSNLGNFSSNTNPN